MMDGADGSLYVFGGMGATGLIDMRASFTGRVSTMAAGLLLAACVGLASADAAEANAYQLGINLFHAEQYEEALPYFVRAKDEARSLAGPASAEHATALNNLGELYRRMEQFDEAEPLFLEAIAIDEARLGPDHQSLAKPLNNLALVQRARGDYVEAERNQKRSLHILEDTVGRRHPDVAGSLNNLARLYEVTGFPERAQPLLERALMTAQGTLGEAHPTTKRIAVNLERVTGTLAGVAPDGDPAGDDGREVAADPLPEPAAALAAMAPPEAISPSDLVAGLDAVAPLGPAQRADPPVPPEPEIVEPAPALAEMDDAADGIAVTAEEIEPAAAPSDLNGAGNGVAEALILPRERPAGLRWPRLPPGGYAMHLASVRNPVSATEEWRRLASQLGLPEVVHQLEPQRIERGEEGVFYRVVGGPFTTSEEAAAACAPVRAKGEYCGVLADGD